MLTKAIRDDTRLHPTPTHLFAKINAINELIVKDFPGNPTAHAFFSSQSLV
jgi:hypothetical protein